MQPTATGSLSRTPFLHLLVHAVERRLSGTLELTLGGASIAAILMHSGCCAKVWTNEPIYPLGVVLANLGMITQAQLDASVDQLPHGRLQGEVLLEMGAITAAQLEAGLRSQIERKVEHLFGLSGDTTFAYFDGVDLLERIGGEPTPIDPLPVMWRGARSAPPWEHVDGSLRRIANARLRASQVAQFERFGFGPRELQVIERLRERPVGVVEMAAALGPSIGQALVYFLTITKQVEVVADSAAPLSSSSVWPTAFPAPPAASTIRPRHAALAAELDAGLDIGSMISDTIKSSVPPSVAAVPTMPPMSASSEYPVAVPAIRPAELPADPLIESIQDAPSAFDKAELLLRQDLNDPHAYELVKRCVALAPRAEYVATLAWLDAQRPEWLGHVKTLEKVLVLDRCIKQDPSCERAFFYRAMLYKRVGKDRQALKDFKKASEINPNNLDALREVRLHKIRAMPGTVEEPGLLRKLFNR